MATKKSTKPAYPKDDGALSKKTVKKLKDSAVKPKGIKKETKLFDIKPEEPGVHIGNYSVRTVYSDGRVDLTIDWDKLATNVEQAIEEHKRSKLVEEAPYHPGYEGAIITSEPSKAKKKKSE
jgi:hypothetical protein